MYDLLLNLMEPNKDKVSFYDRMQRMHEFFETHSLYEKMWPPHQLEPMSFVWAVSSKYPEVLDYQLGALLQVPGLVLEDDQFIFVIDSQRYSDARGIIGNLGKYVEVKQVVVKRDYTGDRPTFNWDIGRDYAKHDRLFFIRDLSLFFDPWKTIAQARSVNIDGELHNLSIILGPVWSKFCDKWMYLVHPRFAPNPFLFAFAANKKNLDDVNGFDQTFRRGYDHLGELDFLLRWGMKGYKYSMMGGEHLLHPGLTANEHEIRDMQFQSSINRRYFFDRYTEEFVDTLEPPYRLEQPLLESNQARTLSPLSEVSFTTNPISAPHVKDPFSFSKRPNKAFIVEEN